MNTKLLAGPVITDRPNAAAATIRSRRRYAGPTAPSTGSGRSASSATSTKRSGSLTQRPISGSAASGTIARANTPAEPERSTGQAVEDRGQPRAHAVAGGDEGHGLGPVGRAGLLGRIDLCHGRRGAEQGAAEREDDDEPPVPGAGCGADGEGQSEPAGHEQDGPPPQAVGQPGHRQGPERGETHDGQPEAEFGARQPGLIGDGRAVRGQTTEALGHVTQRRDRAELAEPGGQGHEPGSHDSGFEPTVQAQRRGPGPIRCRAHPAGWGRRPARGTERLGGAC